MMLKIIGYKYNEYSTASLLLLSHTLRLYRNFKLDRFGREGSLNITFFFHVELETLVRDLVESHANIHILLR